MIHIRNIMHQNWEVTQKSESILNLLQIEFLKQFLLVPGIFVGL